MLKLVNAGLLLLATVTAGCVNDDVAIDPEKAYCEIFEGATRFGCGVLVGASNNGETTIAVLTARHVVTGCNGDMMTIKVKRNNEMVALALDKDIASRWQTIDDAAVDSAWLVLNQNEVKKSGRLCYTPISANLMDFKMPDKGASIRLGDEGSIRRYQGYTENVPMPFPCNTVLTNALVKGGSISELTERSQSGSPVFELDRAGKAVRLLGTSTGSNSNENVTIFMTIADIHDALYGSLTGKNAALLMNLRKFW